jgi:hypothetical protein
MKTGVDLSPLGAHGPQTYVATDALKHFPLAWALEGHWRQVFNRRNIFGANLSCHVDTTSVHVQRKRRQKRRAKVCLLPISLHHRRDKVGIFVHVLAKIGSGGSD